MKNTVKDLAQTTQAELDSLLPYTAQQSQVEKALTGLSRKIVAACLLHLRSCEPHPDAEQQQKGKVNVVDIITNVLTKTALEEEHREAIYSALKQLSPEDATNSREIVTKLRLMDDGSPVNQLHRKLYLLLQQNETAAQAYTYITL